MQPYKTIPFSDGHTLEIHVDDSCESPREWDNLGTMACFHPDYILGDKDHGLKMENFGSWGEMEEWIERELDAAIVYPLFLYDHSGLRIKIGSFEGLLPGGHAEFDSFQVGFIFVSNKRIKQEYGTAPDAIDRAMKVLKAEVETYDQHLRGDVYGFLLRGPDCESCSGPGEVVDSCWGFYGDDLLENGMADHLDKKYQKELADVE